MAHARRRNRFPGKDPYQTIYWYSITGCGEKTLIVNKWLDHVSSNINLKEMRVAIDVLGLVERRRSASVSSSQFRIAILRSWSAGFNLRT